MEKFITLIINNSCNHAITIDISNYGIGMVLEMVSFNEIIKLLKSRTKTISQLDITKSKQSLFQKNPYTGIWMKLSKP